MAAARKRYLVADGKKEAVKEHEPSIPMIAY